jgi:phytoene dehydrogenase-like protein
VDGFLLDRGFQVFLDSYPEARQQLDVKALNLGRFAPGAKIWRGAGFVRVSDPWRDPVGGLRSLLSGIFTPADALRMLRLRLNTVHAIAGEPDTRGAETTARALQHRGFSDSAIEGFFRPFFGGVFLDSQLEAPQHWFEFLFGMFATGSATLPAEGMRALPRQLQASLPAGSVRLNAAVRSLTAGRVELADGEVIEAQSVLLATDAREAAVLLPRARITPWASCATLYYAAPESPVNEPVLVLNGAGRGGPVNHVCVPSDVQSSYAPAGQALISATVIEQANAVDGALDREARAQLQQWFGEKRVNQWRLLRVARVPFSQPRIFPRPDAVNDAVRISTGLYACGDYLETPSINGALRSGRRAAEAVLADLNRR